ncbi:MAG: four helix bundle protein [Acidobacteriia bacterium]|nr:four helix bundle protein [Terriglobia bacterium]
MRRATVKNYRELEVWKKAVGLALTIYKETNAFPTSERFGLTGQMRRAATSVPANVAEGWGRGTTKEYIQFLLIARGSLMELETHVIMSRGLAFLLSERQSGELQSQIQEVGRMLNGLIQSLRKSHAPEIAAASP